MQSLTSMSPTSAAVLTGDLVASQKAAPEVVERAMLQLKQSADYLSTITGHDTRFTRFRGDGWQLVVTKPYQVLSAILLLLADLRASGIGIDTRISAGIGPFDTLGTDNLSDATGRAFLVSGVGLDSMPRTRRLFLFEETDADRTWMSAITELVDWVTDHWTPAQAEAVAIALRFPNETHQQMADRLKITRQAMQSRLSGAGIAPLERAIQAFEGDFWKLRR